MALHNSTQDRAWLGEEIIRPATWLADELAHFQYALLYLIGPGSFRANHRWRPTKILCNKPCWPRVLVVQPQCRTEIWLVEPNPWPTVQLAEQWPYICIQDAHTNVHYPRAVWLCICIQNAYRWVYLFRTLCILIVQSVTIFLMLSFACPSSR